MNLANLVLENFGKFKNFECTFSPGLNVIKGANETGKSTLVEAISKLLYDDPESAGEGSPAGGKTWGAVGPQVLKANINSDDFTGVLEKDFDSGQACLANHDLNIKLDDLNRIREILTGVLGFSSAELFEATSCIKQGSISQIDGSIKAIKDKLESIVTGGQEDLAASRIVAKIDQRIDDISRQDDSNPGLIQKLEQMQTEVDYNIDKISREIKNIKSWRNSLGQVETAYANGLEDFQSKKEKLDRAIKAEQAQTTYKKLTKDRADTISKLEKVKAGAARLKDLSNQLQVVVKIKKEDRRQIDELESKLKYLKPKHKDLEKEVNAHQAARDKFKIGGAPILLIIVSIGGIGLGVADYFLQFTDYFYHISLGGLALLMASLYLISRKNQQKAFLKEQLKSGRIKLEEVASDIEKTTDSLKKLLEKYKINSADEVHHIFWKRNELENQLKAEENGFGEILGGMTEEEIEIKARNYEKEIFDAKKTLENYETMDPAEIERLKLIVSQLEEQKNNLEEELKTLNRQIETAEGGAELLASYLERKEAVSENKIKLVEELTVLGLTKECIEKARQDVMISTLELLEKRTSEILQMITNGKYKQVRFDKTSLKFEVFSDEKNDWVEPHQELSQATVEQIYLTARLALMEILGDKAKPPIILDDTFDRFDPERHDGTMKLLKQMAEDRQILLLTSDDHYDRWADKTIQL